MVSLVVVDVVGTDVDVTVLIDVVGVVGVVGVVVTAVVSVVDGFTYPGVVFLVVGDEVLVETVVGGVVVVEVVVVEVVVVEVVVVVVLVVVELALVDCPGRVVPCEAVCYIISLDVDVKYIITTQILNLLHFYIVNSNTLVFYRE